MLAGSKGKVAGSSDAENTLGVSGEAERPRAEPQPLARQILSLRPCSGLLLGQWEVGWVMLREGQRGDSSQPSWGCARSQ